MLWPTNVRGSFPIIIGSTNFTVGVTGVTSGFGTLQLRRPEYPGSTYRTKVLSAGSWAELGQGLYLVALSNLELGTARGAFLYSYYTKKGIPYYGLVQLIPHELAYLGTIQGSVNARKKSSEGTFNYSLIAQIGTHLVSRITGTVGLATTLSQLGTHLNVRVPGTIKRGNEGTFSYSAIALISTLGTHLQGRVNGSVALALVVGTHLNGRIPGTVKRSVEGTFSYSNLSLIPGLGTHLQSRIPGTAGLATTLLQLGTHLNVRVTGSVADASALGTHLNSRITGTMPSLTVLGTHLNTRIPGTVATRGRLGSIEGTGYAPGTHSLVEIRNNSAGGSTPSYIGSVIWGRMNPNSFSEIANTFGQRIQKILDRASSGVGGVAVSREAFTDKEKTTLFDWIKAMTVRLTAIESLVASLNPGAKQNLPQLIVDVKIMQTKLQESLAGYLKTDTKQKENIKNDLNLIANSFVDITNMHKQVSGIKASLTQLEENLPSLFRTLPETIKEKVGIQTQEIKNLVSQTINIASDISEKLGNNLVALEEQKRSLELTDKVLLSLVPAEKLRDLIEDSNE